jgi:hypothetical protein
MPDSPGLDSISFPSQMWPRIIGKNLSGTEPWPLRGQLPIPSLGHLLVSVIFEQRKHVRHLPEVICDAHRHRRSHSDPRMNLDEIVVHEMQADSRYMVSSVFEKPLVSLVNRRICILMVRFWRST